MTKKHFEAIAAVLKRARDEEARGYKTDAESIAYDLASCFKKFNANFDAKRFIEATEPN